MTLALIILLVYNSATTIIKTVTVKTPSLERHQQLDLKYSETLTCPCTDISISYDKFLHISYQLHEVCSSDFVNDNWINFMFQSQRGIFRSFDFRVTGLVSFNALRSLCMLVNDTIENSLTQFYQNDYVSASITPNRLFQSQAYSFVTRFIASTKNGFLSSLQTIRDTTQGNYLLSALKTNGLISVDHDTWALNASSTQYNGCKCAANVTCAARARVYNGTNLQNPFPVPGMYIGCYIIEALRKSTLECFYNQTCFNTLKYHMNSNLSLNATLLDASLLTKFAANSSIGTILDELMVENWNWSSIYSDYYGICQPLACTYTYKTRNDAIYVITTLISLLGGLVKALKFIVPRSVAIFRRKKAHVTEPETGKIKFIYTNVAETSCIGLRKSVHNV